MGIVYKATTNYYYINSSCFWCSGNFITKCVQAITILKDHRNNIFMELSLCISQTLPCLIQTKLIEISKHNRTFKIVYIYDESSMVSSQYKAERCERKNDSIRKMKHSQQNKVRFYNCLWILKYCLPSVSTLSSTGLFITRMLTFHAITETPVGLKLTSGGRWIGLWRWKSIIPTTEDQ